MTERNNKFLGTYFDRDAVIRIAKVIAILSWVVAGFYTLDVLVAVGIYLLQYMRGQIVGMGFSGNLQNFLYILEPALRGILYFAGLQAASKGLLIFLDIEDNTRRAARHD